MGELVGWAPHVPTVPARFWVRLERRGFKQLQLCTEQNCLGVLAGVLWGGCFLMGLLVRLGLAVPLNPAL